jgi:hypothetical protein
MGASLILFMTCLICFLLILLIIEINLLVLSCIFPVVWRVGTGLPHCASIACLFAGETLGAALLLKIYYFVFTIFGQELVGMLT